MIEIVCLERTGDVGRERGDAVKGLSLHGARISPVSHQGTSKNVYWTIKLDWLHSMSNHLSHTLSASHTVLVIVRM